LEAGSGLDFEAGAQNDRFRPRASV
jgi:hypothetical protein